MAWVPAEGSWAGIVFEKGKWGSVSFAQEVLGIPFLIFHFISLKGMQVARLLDVDVPEVGCSGL